MKIRLKTYKNDVIHERYDMTIEDLDDIQRVIDDIDQILREEYWEIKEEGEDDDSIFNE
jgi:hypothetical protein